MKIFDESVTFPQGFMAQGVEAGIKKEDIKDMAVIFSKTPCQAAGVFTTNKVQAACVQINKQLLQNGIAQAVVVNAGNANACTGELGRQDAYAISALAAKLLDIDPQDVLNASTGVIGVHLPMDRIRAGITEACQSLAENGGKNAATAIMTTDTIPKNIGVELQIGGKTVKIGAMAKGSGMIHPNMATMLAFITTDAAISHECLQKALTESVALSYNMISVDGDTSTNDMALILANGQAGNPMIKNTKSPEYLQFKEALDKVNVYLAKTIARDGEGATRLIQVEAVGALDDMEARKIARSVISSSLFKAAVFGEDANWGRIICAAGYSGGEFDPEKVDIWLGSQLVAKDGGGIPFDEEIAKRELGEETIKVKLDLKQGQGSATAWGCDLTFDYVKINASYRS